MTMFKALTLSTALALSGGAALAAAEGEITDFSFSFEGPFGSFDQLQLQRGLQIYDQICKACHSLQYVAFRTLADQGGPFLPRDQMRAFAEFYEVWDPTLLDGEGDYRLATPADTFPPVISDPQAPDLSLMAKARAGFHGPYGTGYSQFVNGMGGAEYIASILSGFEEEPECALEGEPLDGYYNIAFANGSFPETCVNPDGTHMVPGSYIAMAPPLYGDDVDYADGSPTDIESEAQDVAAFLMWTAEPHMNARKQAGLTGVLALTILAALLYAANARIWAPVKHGKQED